MSGGQSMGFVDAPRATDFGASANGTSDEAPELHQDSPTRSLATVDLSWVGLGLVLLPLVVSALALVVGIGNDYLPSGANALAELRVRDIGRHEALVGLYGQADWSHPGPLFTYLVAPIYWLTGGSSIGLDLGVLAVNVGSIAMITLVARRRGGTPLALCTLVGCSLLVRAIGPTSLHDPWTPSLAILPLVLLIFLVWSMTCGEVWALPAGVVVGSLVAQSHATLAVVALPLLAWGAAWLVVTELTGLQRRRSDPADPARPGGARLVGRALLAGAATCFVLWLPVLLDHLWNSPSNLTRTLDWHRGATEATHTLRQGFQVVLAQFALDADWLGAGGVRGHLGLESQWVSATPRPLLALPLGAAVVALLALRQPAARRLILTLGLVLALSVLAVAKARGALVTDQLSWTWVPALVAFVVAAWAAWLVIAWRWPGAEARLLAPAALGVVVLLSSYNLAQALQPQAPRDDADEASDALAFLTPQVLQALDEDAVVRVDDPFAQAQAFTQGLVLQLERHDVDVTVDAALSAQYGTGRVADAHERVDAVLVVLRDGGITPLESQPGSRIVADWSAPSDETESVKRVAVFLLEDSPRS